MITLAGNVNKQAPAPAGQGAQNPTNFGFELFPGDRLSRWLSFRGFIGIVTPGPSQTRPTANGPMEIDMAKTAKKRASSSKRYVWRDDAGRYHGIIVADPPVRPKTTPVYKIRQAVKKAASGSRAGRKSK